MLIVSNYHYIRNDFKSPFPSIFGNTPTQLKKQLVQLSKMGDFIKPSEFIKNPDYYYKDTGVYILLTFDDGLREQFELAKPILESLGLEAFYFINTANFTAKEVSLVHQIHLLRSVLDPHEFLKIIKRNTQILMEDSDILKASRHYNYDTLEAAELKYLLNFKLTYEEQETLIRPIFEAHFDRFQVHSTLYMDKNALTVLGNHNQLGSHSHRHVPLGFASPGNLAQELTESKEILETLSGQEVLAISYPYGNPEACTKQVATAALTAGYKVGFTMNRRINGPSANSLLLNRFDCNDLPGGKNEKSNTLCELPY